MEILNAKKIIFVLDQM